jgi:hypothetical protein
MTNEMETPAQIDVYQLRRLFTDVIRKEIQETIPETGNWGLPGAGNREQKIQLISWLRHFEKTADWDDREIFNKWLYRLRDFPEYSTADFIYKVACRNDSISCRHRTAAQIVDIWLADDKIRRIKFDEDRENKEKEEDDGGGKELDFPTPFDISEPSPFG